MLDPYFSVAGMKVFNPPPTPGPKETPVPTATNAKPTRDA